VSEQVRVGIVRRAVGLRGEVEIEPLTDDPDRFVAGLELRVGDQSRRVVSARGGRKGVALKFAGVDGRDAAEALLGAYLEVDADKARPLPDGHYYHWQLVGLEVFGTDGTRVGTLEDVLEYPANDVYVVRDGDREVLVPAIKKMVSEIDLDGRRMVVDLPPEAEVR
jgi:16S rRNA processing protein RimM